MDSNHNSIGLTDHHTMADRSEMVTGLENTEGPPSMQPRFLVPKGVKSSSMKIWTTGRRNILKQWGFDIGLPDQPMPLFRHNSLMPFPVDNAQSLSILATRFPGKGRAVVAALTQYCRQLRAQERLTPDGRARRNWIGRDDIREFNVMTDTSQDFEIGNYGASVPSQGTGVLDIQNAISEPQDGMTAFSEPINTSEYDSMGANPRYRAEKYPRGSPEPGFGLDCMHHVASNVPSNITILSAQEDFRQTQEQLFWKLTKRLAAEKGLENTLTAEAMVHLKDVIPNIEALVEATLQAVVRGQDNDPAEEAPDNEPFLGNGQPGSKDVMSVNHTPFNPLARTTLATDIDVTAWEHRVKRKRTQACRKDDRLRIAAERIFAHWGLDTTSESYPMPLLRRNGNKPMTRTSMELLASLARRFHNKGRAVFAAVQEYSNRRRQASESVGNDYIDEHDLRNFSKSCGQPGQYADGNFDEPAPSWVGDQQVQSFTPDNAPTVHSSDEQMLATLFQANGLESPSDCQSPLINRMLASQSARNIPLDPALFDGRQAPGMSTSGMLAGDIDAGETYAEQHIIHSISERLSSTRGVDTESHNARETNAEQQITDSTRKRRRSVKTVNTASSDTEQEMADVLASKFKRR